MNKVPAMDIEVVERLIENVRNNELLYNLNHDDYKNTTMKTAIWNEIGNDVKLSGDAAKLKWRTLRDGYTRYKKLKASRKKNVNYLWATHLAFLDHVNTSSLRASRASANVKHENLSSPPASPPSPEASPLPVHFLEYVDTTPTSSTFSHNVAPNIKTREDSVQEENNEYNAIDYFNSNTKKACDRTDLLFLSYAGTFKQFPPREQALVKLELAKLFGNTELKLLNESPHVD